MSIFYNTFKSTDKIREQYLNIQFYGVESDQVRFAKLFKDDMRYSLFNATNMKLLFELSKNITIGSDGYYETQKLHPLQDEMEIFNTKELYVIYRYLVNLVEYTFVRNGTENNTNDMLSMSFVLTDVIKKEVEKFRVQFNSRLLAALAYQYTKFESCTTSAERFFQGTQFGVI